MRLFTTFSFFIIWALYFLLGECRPYGIERRTPRYTKGEKIIIKVKSSTMGVSKNKEYECTVIGEGRDGVACELYSEKQWAIAKSSKAVEAGRETMDQGIPFDEEVAALKDVGLYIKTLIATDGTRWIVMKNVERGPPPMVNPLELLNAARTKEECLAILKALVERSTEMIEFWIDMKGLRRIFTSLLPWARGPYHLRSHEDPKADNVFVTQNLDQLTLIDYGRSRRVAEMDAKLKNNIEYDSVKGFNPLNAVCNKKPSAPGGEETTFPPLIKPRVTKISDKEKARAAQAQESRILAAIHGGGGGETSQQGAERNA